MVSWRPKSNPRQRCVCTDKVQRRESDNKTEKIGCFLWIPDAAMRIAMKSVKDCLKDGCPAKALRMGVCGLLTGGLSLAEGRGPAFYKDESNLAAGRRCGQGRM